MKKEINRIDMIKLGQLLWQKKKQVLLLCMVGAAIGFAYPMTRPSSYSSTVLVQVNKEANVANLLDNSDRSADNTLNMNILGIVEQLRSPSVIEETVRHMEIGCLQEKDILNGSFVNGLKVENIRYTNLVRITVQGRTPVEAQKLAQGFTDSFITIYSHNKQKVQASKADFLSKQINEARDAVKVVDKQVLAVKNETSQEYRQLQRDAKIKEDIYVGLVKEQEASKIREHFDSMEIQVVAPANQSMIDCGPRSKKMMYVMMGLIVGVLFSLCYVFFCYRKGS